jgi:RNA polymerase sigma-70 factor (ECF subfamily)
MHKIDGLSHKEVAEELGISTKTIENQITKAMKVLKEVFNTNSILVILVIFFIKFFIGA